MKVLASIAWASTVSQSFATSPQTLVYLSDNEHSGPFELPSVTPNTARLLLAQRLGLSQYHELGDPNDSILDILNGYGGSRQHAFAPQDESPIHGHLLVIIEGVEHPEDVISENKAPTLTVSDPPIGSATQRLVLDLLEQDRQQRGREDELCSFRFPKGSVALSGGFNGIPTTQQRCRQLQQAASSIDPMAPLSSLTSSYDLSFSSDQGYSSVLHISTLQGLNRKDGDRYQSAVADVKTLFQESMKCNGGSTIFLTPPSRTLKRSSSYGIYTMPHLDKRQQPQSEEILSTGPASSISVAPSPPETLQTSALAHGIIPVCHPNVESAIDATNNCSGHGTVYKRPSEGKDCFACRCSSTKRTDDDGKVKTVHWGGPACQKKDVSVPFFLLAGLTIGLVAVVAWGTGLLVSIGQEELPSVIGAGVAGPRAQK